MRCHGIRLLSAVLFISQAAFAEQPSQTAAANDTGGLAEVVVTAQRRSENLQNVPMSVTAVSAEQLAQVGVTNTADLSRVTPGLVMAQYSNNLQPAIRGVTAYGANTGDHPGVALYLDGIYQPQQVAALMDLPDVEQIEVLKGPQGTLYGENATGGAIIINTRNPSFTPSGRFSASYGGYNSVDLRAFASGPITDTLAASVSGAYLSHEGYRTQVITGERDGGLQSSSLRAKLLFKPIENIKITLTGYVSDRKDSEGFAVSPLAGNSVGYALIPNAPRVFSSSQFASNPDAFTHVKANGLSARGELTWDVGTLTLVAGHSRSEITALLDLDGSPVNFAEYDWHALSNKSTVTEATFTSRDFGPVNFLVGALYLSAKECFCTGDYVQRTPNLVPDPVSTPAYQVLGTGSIDEKNAAAYVEANYKITEHLTATVGGRYTHESQRGEAGQVGGLNPTDADVLAVEMPYAGNPLSWSQFTPRADLRYEFLPGQNVYASFSEGFKGGLINTSNIQQKAVDPETNKSYEIGYKGRPADNLAITVAAFLYDYKNLQVSSYIDNNTYITENAASSRGKGLESTLDWAIAKGLTLSAGAAYLDATFRDFKAAQGFQSTGFGNNPIQIDRSGDRLPRSPTWTADLSADYVMPTTAGALGANASLYYTSAYTLDPLGIIEQSGYVTLNGNLSFSPAAWAGLRLVLWGKNLTDKAYFAQGQANALGTQIAWADPRTYGLRAEFTF